MMRPMLGSTLSGGAGIGPIEGTMCSNSKIELVPAKAGKDHNTYEII